MQGSRRRGANRKERMRLEKSGPSVERSAAGCGRAGTGARQAGGAVTNESGVNAEEGPREEAVSGGQGTEAEPRKQQDDAQKQFEGKEGKINKSLIDVISKMVWDDVSPIMEDPNPRREEKTAALEERRH